MDSHSHQDVLPRRINQTAASRYARPPPPVPVVSDIAPPRVSPLPRVPPVIPQQSSPTRSSPRIPIITLDQVRPGPRTQNEYVDSPQLAGPIKLSNNNSLIQNESWTLADRSSLVIQSHQPVSNVNQNGHSHLQAITSQPVSATTAPSGLKKDSSTIIEDDHQGQDSIICPRCNKCKCHACTTPRELPSHWVCDKKFECSATKIVDIASCLCCAKCIFYHCLKDVDGEDENPAADDPCSCCERPHCCKRWTCMGILSFCLPCLCLYWPLQCGVAACTACYNRCTRRGCNCRRDKIPSANKRLLFDSESSSA